MIQHKKKQKKVKRIRGWSEINNKRKWEHKSEEQKSTIKNFKMFYKAQEKFIKLFDGYSTILAETKYKATHGRKAQNINSY